MKTKLFKNLMLGTFAAGFLAFTLKLCYTYVLNRKEYDNVIGSTLALWVVIIVISYWLASYIVETKKNGS